MGWSTDDGRHEGRAAPLFGDGAVGSGWEPGGVSVPALPTRELPFRQWQVRPETDTVGWVGACSCGWRSTPYARVGDPDDEDRSARRAHSRDSVPPRWVEDTVHRDWRIHADAHDAIAEVALRAREVAWATHRLGEAVLLARLAGASWTGIGGAAGLAAQSARERWAGTAAADAPRCDEP